MLKSCRYCGRVHPKGYECPKKPAPQKRTKMETEQNKFRSKNSWAKKSKAVRRREIGGTDGVLLFGAGKHCPLLFRRAIINKKEAVQMSKKKKRLLIYCILAGIGAAIVLSDCSFGTLGLLLTVCAAVGIWIEFFKGIFLE